MRLNLASRVFTRSAWWAGVAGGWLTLFGCGGAPSEGEAGSGGAPSAGGAASGGAAGTGGTRAATGGREGAGGVAAAGGNSAVGGSAAGHPSAGGQVGSGGAVAGTCGGEILLERPGAPLNCGERGHIFEAAGSPANRVNYVIVGDGYDSELIETRFVEHVENMLEDEQGGFYSAIGEPYARYRNFINICGLKLASADSCIDNADIGRSCDTLFDGRCEPPCDAAGTRLGVVSENKVNMALAEELPDDIDADWVAVTLNADPDGWWNSGGSIMVWNGGFRDRLQGASVALHEGGHTFHGLADEYGGTSQNCGEYQELNSTSDPEGEKWAHWLEYNDERDDARPLPPNLRNRPYGTFVQGVYEGSRYCDRGQYRPSRDSEMNLLPQPFNMPSVEKIILDIYSIVQPIDAHTDNSSPLTAPGGLQVRVVDPELLKIEWTVDGELAQGQNTECFVLSALASGNHEITVRVFDDTSWVRRERDLLEQSVTWEVIVP